MGRKASLFDLWRSDSSFKLTNRKEKQLNHVLVHNHSFFSLLDGKSSPSEIAITAKEMGCPAVALTDHYVVGGVIDFYKECLKQDIKPIIGCEFGVCQQQSSIKSSENRKLNHLIVLAKNHQGVFDLFSMITKANENFYYNPRLDKSEVFDFSKKGNIVATSACIGGIITPFLFSDPDSIYHTDNEGSIRKNLKEDWLEIGCKITNEWVEAFDGSFFLEAQMEDMVVQKVALECLREISKSTGVPLLASGDSHFCKPEDAIAHEALIASQTKSTIQKRQELRDSGKDIIFNDNSNYYMHSAEDLLKNFTEKEVGNTIIISDLIEPYSLELGKPRLPRFHIDGNPNKTQHFRDLCVEGLKKLGKENHKYYIDRMEEEIKVFSGIKTGEDTTLLDYFLIIKDIVDFIRSKGSMTPIGRGSASGALITTLLGICKVDAIKYNLSKERFYNSGRMNEENISLPDIDLDVPVEMRQDVIDYLSEKYGSGNVAQICTYGTLKPKAAIKEAFRVREIEFQDVNVLTKTFPEDEIKHTEGAENSIESALQLSEEFAKSVEQYKAEIQIACGLQGVVKSRGIHPAAVVIADRPLGEFLPLVYDTKSKRMVIGFDMHCAEDMGAVKFDILGLKLISTINLIRKSIENLKAQGIEELPAKKRLTFKEIALEYFEQAGYSLEKINGSMIFSKDGKTIEVKIKEAGQNMEIKADEYLLTNRSNSVFLKQAALNGGNEFLFGNIQNGKLLRNPSLSWGNT